MDIKKLQHLVTVARTGSISGAAEELHITQPALSRSISNLEARYGLHIFERGRRGATLTTVGKLAVEEAEELLRRSRTVEQNFRLLASGEAGRIAFGMGPLIASLVMRDLSCFFLRERPGLHLRASVKSADLLLRELEQDSIELLFCAGGQIEPSAERVVATVGAVELAMLVRAGHPLAGEGQVTLEALARFPLLSGAEHSGRGLGKARGSFICDNYHILAETVLDSDGIWMSSPQLVADRIASGELVRLTVADNPRPEHVEVSVVRSAGRLPSPAAEAVVGFVRGRLATD